MKIAADSGSTKTAWCLWNNDKAPVYMETQGMNPIMQDADTIRRTLNTGLRPLLERNGCPDPGEITDVFFYGAGCLPQHCPSVSCLLREFFTHARVEVQSDLIGAARALCGRQPGIACILGTGSNSCLYDGTTVIAHTPPLGFILGDEGSGAVLGRQMVGSMLKGVWPEELKTAFLQRFSLSPADIIERVYRQPMPNRFLASLTPFLYEHRNHPSVHALLIEQFGLFFRRNIIPYARPELPVHFVGSIASVFLDELQEAARQEGCVTGTILASPIRSIQIYHAETVVETPER